jgi:hypothetical protein
LDPARLPLWDLLVMLAAQWLSTTRPGCTAYASQLDPGESEQILEFKEVGGEWVALSATGDQR